MTSLAQATQIAPLSPTTYSAYLPEDWCIGSVPHGGVVATLFLRAASTHLATQPHTLVLHLTFLRRTAAGPALLTVSAAKLGARTSILHIVLSNPSDPSTPLVAGYVTQTHLAAEQGLSLPTDWALAAPAPPPPLGSRGVKGLKDGVDERWTERELPFTRFRRAVGKVRIWTPAAGQAGRGTVDEWLCWRDEGQRFTQESLGYVADLWPQVVEGYREGPGGEQEGGAAGGGDGGGEGEGGREMAKQEWAVFWYPTVTMTLEVKKLLPAEGVEFLFVRVRTKQIRNGRFDLEVVIMDEEGDLVALSHHVCLIVSAERNMAPRKNGKDRGDSKESKI